MIRGKEVIQIVRKTITENEGEPLTDDYGNLLYTNDNDPEEPVLVGGCLVAWGASTVEVDLTGYEFEQLITIMAPFNTDIKASDDIIWNNSIWRPIGKPIQWAAQYRSPNKPRVIVVCKLVEEGYI